MTEPDPVVAYGCDMLALAGAFLMMFLMQASGQDSRANDRPEWLRWMWRAAFVYFAVALVAATTLHWQRNAAVFAIFSGGVFLLIVNIVDIMRRNPPARPARTLQARPLRNATFLAILASIALLYHMVRPAASRDLGQWEGADPDLRAWYQGLMRPDAPTASCCGIADAYFCDDYAMRDGKATCVITDDRPDEPRGRPHVEMGTVIEIPSEKLMRDGGNPTGRGVIFMTKSRYVWCYVQGGGA